MATRDETLETAVALLRRVVAELNRHDEEYHHRTNERLLQEVDGFLASLGIPRPEAQP